jgi:hypothetical protein
MVPYWILALAAIELIGGVVFWRCIATAVPEGLWLRPASKPDRRVTRCMP